MSLKQVIQFQIVGMVIKNALQSKINDLIVNYNNNTGVTIKCVINSVNPAFDPFEVEVNSSILL